MTIDLQPHQEQAIQRAISSGAFRSIDEFIDTAIALLPPSKIAEPSGEAPRKSRLWDLREGLSLGDVPIRELIEEGRE
jgi:Arc/MetJ-type ribon-helix-helix transcriptional regulator